jgi:hypothetical protein
MEWHLRNVGMVHDHEEVTDSKHFIGRKKLMKDLAERYNCENKFPIKKTIKLPVSGSVVKISTTDIGAAIQ